MEAKPKSGAPAPKAASKAEKKEAPKKAEPAPATPEPEIAPPQDGGEPEADVGESSGTDSFEQLKPYLIGGVIITAGAILLGMLLMARKK